MKNMSRFRLSFWLGVFAEIIACVSVVLCLGYGTTAPGGAASKFLALIGMFHMPGLWLGALLAKVAGEFIFLPFTIFVGMVSFAIIFWMIISLRRRLRLNIRPPNTH